SSFARTSLAGGLVAWVPSEYSTVGTTRLPLLTDLIHSLSSSLPSAPLSTTTAASGVCDWSKPARRRAQNGHQSAKKTVTCSVVSGVTIAIFRQRPFVHN